MRIYARPWAFGLALTLTFAVAACGGRPRLDEAEPDVPTVLEVENQSNFDMTIYAVQESGARTRLGMVTAHTTRELTVPPRLIFGIAALRFQADPIGATAEPVSQTIPVEAGDTIVMTIPPF